MQPLKIIQQYEVTYRSNYINDEVKICKTTIWTCLHVAARSTNAPRWRKWMGNYASLVNGETGV